MRMRHRLISNSIEKVSSGDAEEIEKVHSYDARTCDNGVRDHIAVHHHDPMNDHCTRNEGNEVDKTTIDSNQSPPLPSHIPSFRLYSSRRKQKRRNSNQVTPNDSEDEEVHLNQNCNGKRASYEISTSNGGQNNQVIVEDEDVAPIHSIDKNGSTTRPSSNKNGTSDENCVDSTGDSSIIKLGSRRKIHPLLYDSSSSHEMKHETQALKLEKDPKGARQTLFHKPTRPVTANTTYQRLMDYFASEEDSDASSNRVLSTFVGMMAFFLIAVFCISLLVLVMMQSHPSDNLQLGEEVHGSKSIKMIQVFNTGSDGEVPINHSIIPPPMEKSVHKNKSKKQTIQSQLHEGNYNRQTIINGQSVVNSQEEYPYVVSLLQRNTKRQAWHTCGGVMITPNVILTAAHCYSSVHIAHIGLSRADHQIRRQNRSLRQVHKISNHSGKEGVFEDDDDLSLDDDIFADDETINSASTRRSLYSSSVNINRLSNNKSFGKAYSIRYWDKIQHPKFDPLTGAYDLMLIKLPAWNPQAATVKMNQNPSIPKTNDQVVVLGWGVTQASDGDSLSEILQRAPLFSVSNQRCEKMYAQIYKPPVVRESMLCAHSFSGKDACKGDSGGPLIKEHPNDPSQDVVLGVVSWGESCGNSYFPGVYARISEAHSWINDRVCNVLSPDSCVNGRIGGTLIQGDLQPGVVCEDHVGILPRSRYRSCAWVKRYAWLGCLLYKDECPKTCGVKKC